jgi:tRNA (Thr-GGU) A37 N-methylase
VVTLVLKDRVLVRDLEAIDGTPIVDMKAVIAGGR